MIEEYFREYDEKCHEKKIALKRYIDAKAAFYTITGIKYDEMPKAQGRVLGLDDLMIQIEELHNDYIEKYENCEIERKKCLEDINKLENKISRVIIECTYLNFESDKEILFSLKEFFNKEYSLSHIKRLKKKAIKEFIEIIDTL